MILLTSPIFHPVISIMEFEMLDLAAMQVEAAMQVLAYGAPKAWASNCSNRSARPSPRALN